MASGRAHLVRHAHRVVPQDLVAPDLEQRRGEAGRIASLAAAYVVEQAGTMEHSYTLAEFGERYVSAFGAPLPAAFAAS